ncbi:hypothetical protein [Amaricoccus macauensis]|uniref:hypothetical protein n=1 Tax=Amaricoccus macauensis TaxID=57001 RepID=UPI003C7DC0B8
MLVEIGPAPKDRHRDGRRLQLALTAGQTLLDNVAKHVAPSIAGLQLGEREDSVQLAADARGGDWRRINGFGHAAMELTLGFEGKITRKFK